MVFLTIPEILDKVFDFFDLAAGFPLLVLSFDVAPLTAEDEDEEEDGGLVAGDASAVGRVRAGKAPDSVANRCPPC